MQKKEKNKVKDTNHPRLLNQYSHGEMTSWGGEACLIGFKIHIQKREGGGERNMVGVGGEGKGGRKRRGKGGGGEASPSTIMNLWEVLQKSMGLDIFGFAAIL